MLTFVWISTLAVVAYACWLGSAPERQGAVIIATWYVADPIYHMFSGPAQFRFVDPGHVVMDSIETLAIGYVALRANRVWPLWVTAAETTAISGHISVLAEPIGLQKAYYAVTQLPIYLQLLALACGTFAHHRSFLRIGPYRDWRIG
ncbi:MAG: hypothetical protein P0Y56_02795 [Candidatus Andeanibacterium colombiense]|uniref:Uncharacterized protein n=1 Tax=Candidatus Andeanibacterium colombiense TaxID=3121345 RepID=A0AAJ6BQ08_9SPHN|nr:MAG: hypothetical protein P0Y56_02795 [Sphingomonadaceae bacterium]